MFEIERTRLYRCRQRACWRQPVYRQFWETPQFSALSAPDCLVWTVWSEFSAGNSKLKGCVNQIELFRFQFFDASEARYSHFHSSPNSFSTSKSSYHLTWGFQSSQTPNSPNSVTNLIFSIFVVIFADLSGNCENQCQQSFGKFCEKLLLICLSSSSLHLFETHTLTTSDLVLFTFLSHMSKHGKLTSIEISH